MCAVDIRLGTAEDLEEIAQLVWCRTRRDSDTQGASAEFLARFGAWLAAHEATHLPFLALNDKRPVGIGWLALVPRVPGRDCASRLSGDIQSVYVVPEQRSQRIGASLVTAMLRYADGLAVEHVTVHSSDRAVALYKRAAFAAIRELLYRQRR